MGERQGRMVEAQQVQDGGMPVRGAGAVRVGFLDCLNRPSLSESPFSIALLNRLWIVASSVVLSGREKKTRAGES